jgi:hypothetical protein
MKRWHISGIFLSLIILIPISSVIRAQSQDTKIEQVEYSFNSDIDLFPFLMNNEVSSNETIKRPQSLIAQIENQDEVNSKLDISVDNQSYGLSTDYELTYNLFYMEENDREIFADVFGLIMTNNWADVRDIMTGLTDDESWSIDMEEQDVYLLIGSVNTMSFIISTPHSDTELFYEYDTGLLVAAFHNFEIKTPNYSFQIELSKVNGDSSYFENYYVEQSSSDPSIPLEFITFIILLGMGIFILAMLFRKTGKSDTHPQSTNKLTPFKFKSVNYKTIQQDQIMELSDQVTFVNIPIEPYKIRSCCYQTARLGETYCPCGRVVSQEIREFFMSV